MLLNIPLFSENFTRTHSVYEYLLLDLLYANLTTGAFMDKKNFSGMGRVRTGILNLKLSSKK